ncbi:magnesium transporter CorA family protein [Roseovarius mucosus]|uniref:Magnesium transport protein CorA n=1 Tax=Roseovarius mucosus TaxID=215743 RepID=A0A1V0RM06_9RHOB|nr:magnesium transporter CorA family protein [Roseovarius mucosus]ARE82808.1 magnesium transport protein CorA [Roseovarius mucosus]MBW4973478.1 magnesium transporter CorA family protein [Roseovarius mucosus]
MITYYAKHETGLHQVPDLGDAPVLWIDMLSPDPQELAQMSGRLGIALPSREDQDEIEQSSRLYLEEGVPVMTALLPARNDAGETIVGPVSFVLMADRLVTLRHHAPRPFTTYPDKAGKSSHGCATVEAVLIGLIEEIIDRLADIIEQAGRDIDALSKRIFGDKPLNTAAYRTALRDIGQADGRVMQIRESLMTLERLLGFVVPVIDTRRGAKPLRGALKSQYRDVRTITEQAGYLQQKTAFMLDAALGLITIEQNAIIKIFSVAAVAFLPPTLVASIYGMNFEVMPELSWPFGYPMALGLMALSALVPLWIFRRRGWL